MRPFASIPVSLCCVAVACVWLALAPWAFAEEVLNTPALTKTPVLNAAVEAFPFAQPNSLDWKQTQQNFNQLALSNQPLKAKKPAKEAKPAKAPKPAKVKKPSFWSRLFHRNKVEAAPRIAITPLTPLAPASPAKTPQTPAPAAPKRPNLSEETATTSSKSTPASLTPPAKEAPATLVAMAPTPIAGMANLATSALTGVVFPSYWQEGKQPRPSSQELALMQFIQRKNKNNTPYQAQVMAHCLVGAAEAYQVDVRLLASLIATESSFRPEAVSPTGAKGMGQLLDSTARWLGVSNSFDVEQNVYATAKYLNILGQKFPKNPAEAVASYYVGQGTVEREGLSEDAIRYVLKVQDHLLELLSMAN